MTTAIYPGSFDPITNGHLDIIERASKLFDRVVVAVLSNPAKSSLFTPEERVGLIERSVVGLPHVTADLFAGLLVDYCYRHDASVIIRGIRAVSDFEYEFQMALMNRRLRDEVETLFMMPQELYTYLSSRLVKEVFSLGGSVRGLVPDFVLEALTQKYPSRPNLEWVD